MSAARLTFLLDEDDLACLQVRFPDALSGHVLAFDPDLHVALLDRGIAHITPWDVVDHNQWGALGQLADDLWRYWSRHARAEYDCINLLGMAAYRHMTCFSRLTWAGFVIARSLETLRPQEVVVFDEPTGHGLDQPAGYRKMPLLFALLRGMAERAGIAVTALLRDGESAEPGFTDHAAMAAQRDLPRLCPEEHLHGRPYILASASGPDIIRQLPVIEALGRETDYPAVQLYKSADERTLRAARAIGHHLWHESQVAWDEPPPDVRELSSRARESFAHAGQNATGILAGIFGNRHMDTHFDFIFGEYLTKMAWQVQTWTRFFEAHRPGMILASYPAPILDVAHRRGIPCLVLPHSGLMIGNERWFGSLPPVTIGALGALHRDRLADAGIAAERIQVTGVPIMDRLVRRGGAQAEPKADDIRALRDRIGLRCGGPMVLIGTGNLGMPAKMTDIPYVDWSDAAACFERLGELAARRPDWTFVLKCHPHFDHPALYDRVNRRLPDGCRITVVTDEPLERLGRLADVVVFHNVLTSGLLEASCCGKPVYLLAQSFIEYDADRWATSAWPHVLSVEELEEELVEMFANPESCAKRVAQTRAALRHYLGDDGTSSVDRCVGLIRKTMTKELETVECGR